MLAFCIILYMQGSVPSLLKYGRRLNKIDNLLCLSADKLVMIASMLFCMLYNIYLPVTMTDAVV